VLATANVPDLLVYELACLCGGYFACTLGSSSLLDRSFFRHIILLASTPMASAGMSEHIVNARVAQIDPPGERSAVARPSVSSMAAERLWLELRIL
jgi:hypothetical protein